MIGDDLVEGYSSYDEFVLPFPPEPLPEEVEGFAMLYSSGTTGHPKGVRRALTGDPFGTSATLVPMLSGIMGFGEGDVYLSPAPLYHSAPLVWSMTVQRMGGTAVIMDHFDPERCLQLIAEHRITHAQFVPTMFVRLPQAARGGAQRLRRLVTALGRPRRGPVRTRGQAAHDRVVGPDHP